MTFILYQLNLLLLLDILYLIDTIQAFFGIKLYIYLKILKPDAQKAYMCGLSNQGRGLAPYTEVIEPFATSFVRPARSGRSLFSWQVCQKPQQTSQRFLTLRMGSLRKGHENLPILRLRLNCRLFLQLNQPGTRPVTVQPLLNVSVANHVDTAAWSAATTAAGGGVNSDLGTMSIEEIRKVPDSDTLLRSAPI